MDDVADWLRGRRYYEDQLVDDRTVPGSEARLRDVPLESRLADALADRGIDSLYAHQADAIEAVRDGENAVLATQTASGKSLAYTVPAFERAMDHGGRTLYLGPTNALLADQADSLSSLARDLGFGSRVSVDQYTGRLSQTEKQDVRDRRPTVLLSNPDMLHYALLPHAHRLWEWFFSGLETVVVDEVHEYRGVFGSHVALTLRRLARICERFDADPDWVCCSATVANPVDHASTVTGQPADSFRLVDDDASESGSKRWLSWNPPETESGRRSGHVESMKLFADLVSRGYQTLVFTRARQAAERYAMDSADRLRERGESDRADSVAAYHAALTPERRRELETGLRDGDVRGAWTTNALELGVDVGGLDAVILDGYPGTRMETFQRAGRAGRGDDASLVCLVAGGDQLDQYVMRNPDDLFDGDPERAVANPENGEILPAHVVSAAAENWLSRDDERHFGERFPDTVATLESAGRLDRRDTRDGVRWTSTDGSPQHDVSLRTIEDREVTLLDQQGDDAIGSLPLGDALRDAHPGAIYHHQGETFEVADLDLDRDVATLSRTWADYHTRVLTDKDVTVERDVTERRPLAREDVPVRRAELTVRERVTGFERRDATRGTTLGRQSLSLPEQTLRTEGLYYTVPEDVERDLRAAEGDFAGAIHAAEHAMISLLPLTVLCDRGDVGGLSTPRHQHTGASTVFIYDGHPGGVGLTRAAFEEMATLTDRTRSLLAECPCDDGCPACVQSPQCGNANEPLDKPLARRLLDAFAGDV
ncbi:MAG: DEAD/DEAH box helicase [Halobacteriaceae archaeon]